MRSLALGAACLIVASAAFVFAAWLRSTALALVGCVALVGLFAVHQTYVWRDSPRMLFLIGGVVAIVVVLSAAAQALGLLG